MKKNCCGVYYKLVIIQNQIVIFEKNLKQYWIYQIMICQIMLLNKNYIITTGVDTPDLAAKKFHFLEIRS